MSIFRSLQVVVQVNMSMRATLLVLALSVAQAAADPAPALAATRAASALADLASRGYPSAGAGVLVGVLARGEGRKLGRLVAALEVLRKAEGMSQAQALETVRAAVAAGADPDSAVKRGV